MRVKVFLLAVVCVSFVQVRGDHHSENPVERGFNLLTKANSFVDTFKTGIQSEPKTSDEELKDAISEGLLLADTIHKLIVRLVQKQWTNLNDIRQIIVSNSTEYTYKAKNDEEKLKSALYRVAEHVREEGRYLENDKLIVQCVDGEENKAKEDVKSNLQTFVAEIWHLSLEFNKTHPEYPFLMVHEVLKYPYNQTVQSIKGCKNKECVDAMIKQYNTETSNYYNEYLKAVTKATTDFIVHQQNVRRFYRETIKTIENIYVAAVRDMRKCLYIKESIIAKLLGFG